MIDKFAEFYTALEQISNWLGELEVSLVILTREMGRDSSVSIATRDGLDCPGI